MTMAVGAELAAVLATVLAVGGAWPQLRRVAVTGDGAGVSTSCAALGLVTELAWIVYSIRGHMWSALPEACLMAAGNAGLLVLLVSAGRSLRASVVAALGWAGVVGAFLLAGQASTAALLAFAYAAQAAPAVWCVYRALAPTGVARATWVLVGVEAALWGVYGVSHADPANIMFGVIGSSAALAILLRTRRRQYGGSSRAVLPDQADASGGRGRDRPPVVAGLGVRLPVAARDHG